MKSYPLTKPLCIIFYSFFNTQSLCICSRSYVKLFRIICTGIQILTHDSLCGSRNSYNGKSFAINFSTSIPFVSVIASILHMIYGSMGLYILSVVCLIIPAVVFLCMAIYIFFQFERTPTIEVELDTLQLGLIQLATILVAISSLIIIFSEAG